MNRTEITALYQQAEQYDQQLVTVCGWIKTLRNAKMLGFLELHDGSCFKSLQVVFEQEQFQEEFSKICKWNVGTAVIVQGKFFKTPQAKQPFELQATEIRLEGQSDGSYPLQKKRHSLEFLRTIAHLRSRTNTFHAVFRVRSVVSFAIHEFFQQQGFICAHTPIITGNDCEGAGELFRVTTLDPIQPPCMPDGQVDFSKDFFQQPTGLTVSGQLEGECMALAFGKIYTFGPTFRAENSNTTRHAAEFWMIEPEMAFANLEDIMTLAQQMMTSILSSVLEKCPDELQFFNDFYDKGLLERLNHLLQSDFDHISYTKAVALLEQHQQEFQYPVHWGCDLQTEHERFLTEKIFKKPVFVTDYPKEIKAFYMKLNHDNKTVAAMDLLVPGVGEIIGGSQREDSVDLLTQRMIQSGIDPEDYQWYLDLRRYGGTTHAGFGLGFERLLMYLTGMSNIRDVILFPRTTGNASF